MRMMMRGSRLLSDICDNADDDVVDSSGGVLRRYDVEAGCCLATERGSFAFASWESTTDQESGRGSKRRRKRWRGNKGINWCGGQTSFGKRHERLDNQVPRMAENKANATSCANETRPDQTRPGEARRGETRPRLLTVTRTSSE